MIEYILAHSPDNRILKKASDILNNDGIVCLPTDTNWILVASPNSKNGIEKLYKIKEEGKDKHFSLLCSDIKKASEVAMIDNNAFRILKKLTPGHYTFIFEATKKAAKFLKASKTNKEVGLRFVPSVLVNTFIDIHEEVLVSTNIPRSMLSVEESDEIYSYQIEEELASIVDMIIDPGEIEFSGMSSIIDLTTEAATVIREGAGDLSLFN